MEIKPPLDLYTWLQGDGGRAAIAGALGGVVRWVTLRESWREGLMSLIVGSICASYLGPLVAPILEPMLGRITPMGDNTGLTAFLVGIGGISISGLLIDIFRARRAKGGSDDSSKP